VLAKRADWKGKKLFMVGTKSWLWVGF